MNSTIKIFSYRFQLQEFLILFATFFLMENIFSWIFIRNSIIIEGYSKLLGLFIYGFMLYRFNHLKKSERLLISIFTLIMLKLVLESLAKYDTPFKQLTMFTVYFPVIFILFMKYILRSTGLNLLPFMAKFYLITYIVFMLLFGRGFSFSLDAIEMADYGPFSGDGRIIHASHIFMMIIPMLWYLHRFLDTKKSKYLAALALCVLIIIIHQHRSVWSSACVALLIFIVSSTRNKIQNLSKFGSFLMGTIATVLLAGFFIANLFPGFLEFLSDRFSEIFDPAKEGSTGNFRIQQRETYFALYLQRPVFGWTFEGFEMPNPLVDWWPAGSGQHFHEGFMEMLFYHGAVGLIFKYGFLVYLFIKGFGKKLGAESVVLISFCSAGLLFSFSYVLPLVFWGFVGMALYYLEKDKEQADEAALDNNPEVQSGIRYQQFAGYQIN